MTDNVAINALFNAPRNQRQEVVFVELLTIVQKYSAHHRDQYTLDLLCRAKAIAAGFKQSV